MRCREPLLVAQSRISSSVAQPQLEQTIERMPRPISRRICSQAGYSFEEADESLYWLELVREGKLITESKLSPLLNRG